MARVMCYRYAPGERSWSTWRSNRIPIRDTAVFEHGLVQRLLLTSRHSLKRNLRNQDFRALLSPGARLTSGPRTGALLRVDLSALNIGSAGPLAAAPYVSTCLAKARAGDKTFEQYSECRLTDLHVVPDTPT